MFHGAERTMAKPTGSTPIDTAWKLKLGGCLHLLTLARDAFEEGDQASQSRTEHLNDAIAQIEAVGSKTTRAQANDIMREVTKCLAYAFAVRSPR